MAEVGLPEIRYNPPISINSNCPQKIYCTSSDNRSQPLCEEDCQKCSFLYK